MRRLIVTVVAPILATTAIAAEPPKPHNVLLFVAEAASGHDQRADNASHGGAAQARRHFSNTHAVFPTLTTVNAASIATGHMPGDTGDFGNTIYAGFPVPGAGGSLPRGWKTILVLGEIDAHFGGNYLNEESILRTAVAYGISTAAIGKLGPSLILDHTDRAAQQTMIIDDQTGQPGGIPVGSEMQIAFQEFGLANGAPSRGDNGQAGDAAILEHGCQRRPTEVVHRCRRTGDAAELQGSAQAVRHGVLVPGPRWHAAQSGQFADAAAPGDQRGHVPAGDPQR